MGCLKDNNEVRLKIRDSRNKASCTGQVPHYLALHRGHLNASIETVTLVAQSRGGSPIAVSVAVIGPEGAPGMRLLEWHDCIPCSVRERV